ncbi:MAG TPA: TIGR00282 family metallophosphoesterase [Nitrospiria bacterium]
MNVLLIGDIVGEPGRKAVARRLEKLVRDRSVDLVVANCENAAGGFGVTPKIADELFFMGIDVLTTGNHVWDKREIISYIPTQPRLLRPANLPPNVPGSGSYVFELSPTEKVGVIQIMGKVFMPLSDCPFQTVRREVSRLREITPNIIVDVHAEATSEKRAMGWFLDGQVTAVVGTHTHVQTADEEILPKGTAYISDLGMTGPFQSVIGMNRDIVLRKFLDHMPQRMEVAGGPCVLSGALVSIGSDGRAGTIERIQERDDY